MNDFQPIDRLDARVAVVAGGLGAVGRATARRLAQAGARVGVLHRRTEEEAASFLAALPGEGHFSLAASITDSPALARAAQQVAERFGLLHILVNTAGFTRPVPMGDLEALDDALIDAIFQSNWRGVVATIRAFRALLKASGDGVIVNVSSIAPLTGQGSNLAYLASKAGIDAIARPLARALAPEVRILTVSPGVVESDFVPGRGREYYDKAAATTPLRRTGRADDVAAAIVACATSLRFATGQTIVVDGGRSL